MPLRLELELLFGLNHTGLTLNNYFPSTVSGVPCFSKNEESKFHELLHLISFNHRNEVK